MISTLSGSLSTIKALLNVAFRVEKDNIKPINPSSISAQQLEVLQLLYDKPFVWMYGTALLYFRRIGLPGSKQEMTEFLEQAKATMDMTNE